MFGFFRKTKKETPPVKLSADIEIDATAEDVFACLDPGAPNSRLARLGWTVTPSTTNPGRLFGASPDMPDVDFIFDIVEYGYPHRLGLRSSFADGQGVGALVEETSTYTLTALAEGGCRLDVEESITLETGLNGARLQQETAMLVVALHDDLARLKALLEVGEEAAETAGMLDEFFASMDESKAVNG